MFLPRFRRKPPWVLRKQAGFTLSFGEDMTKNLSARTLDTIYPRGEGLLGEGPVAPGPGEVNLEWARQAVAGVMNREAEEAGEALEELAEALKPQLEREANYREESARKVEANAKDASFRILVQEMCEGLERGRRGRGGERGEE